MSDYELLDIGGPEHWRTHFGGFRPDSSRDGRRVVDHELSAKYIGLTANALAPGEQAGYWHTHSQIEELYVFIAGEGQMGLDDDLLEVRAGSVVRVGPNVARTWRARPDSTGELRWLCIRAGGTELTAFPEDAARIPNKPMPWDAATS
ncbi:MAG TPA: cupin domain-containing protein [Microbacteriaceae bacterium]|nr:cupin domain-containing protein [Microbacteriaceae bacterium]